MQAHRARGRHRLGEVRQEDPHHECHELGLGRRVREDSHDEALGHAVDEDPDPYHDRGLQAMAAAVFHAALHGLGRRQVPRALEEVREVGLRRQQPPWAGEEAGHVGLVVGAAPLVRLGLRRLGVVAGVRRRGVPHPAELLQRGTPKLCWARRALRGLKVHRDRQGVLVLAGTRATCRARDERLPKSFIALGELVDVVARHDQHRCAFHRCRGDRHRVAEDQVLCAEQLVGADDVVIQLTAAVAAAHLRVRVADLRALAADHLHAPEHDEVDGAQRVDVVEKDVAGFELGLLGELHEPLDGAWRAIPEDLRFPEPVDRRHRDEVLEPPVRREEVVDRRAGDAQDRGGHCRDCLRLQRLAGEEGQLPEDVVRPKAEAVHDLLLQTPPLLRCAGLLQLAAAGVLAGGGARQGRVGDRGGARGDAVHVPRLDSELDLARHEEENG
mmetsp:Transcript_13944/g.39694  ORF Transcript_13944/g.39694 Transcript_13944/m.39694 type:complete len:442 (+) Transcript_13944:488-1813(+)